MARKATNRRLPKLGRHSSGQARVTLNGKGYYLGKFGSLAAQKAYAELIERWEANDRQPLDPVPHVRQTGTLRDLADEYLAHIDATGRYRKNGERTSPRWQTERALDDFCARFGKVRLSALAGSMLRLHVDDLLAKPHLTRTGINRKLRMILSALRWARERDLLPRDRWLDLADVRPLKCGTVGTAREQKKPKRAVSVEDMERAAAAAISPIIGRMMRVQAATGMRPGDVCKMRWSDLGPETEVDDVRCRVYIVASAKTAHHGRETTYLLPESVLEMLGTPTAPGALVFPSPVTGRPYSGTGYRDGVATACQRAGLEPFTPHELRHGYLTRACARYGVAVASTLANHGNIAVTARYVHPDRDAARSAAIGLLRPIAAS